MYALCLGFGCMEVIPGVTLGMICDVKGSFVRKHDGMDHDK